MTRDLNRRAHGPEWYVQRDLIEFLGARGWHVENMHGNQYQKGIPDLYAFHQTHRERWIDAKVEGAYSFTPAQRDKWPKWEAAGIGIWILTAADQAAYDKLFAPPNWRDYWKDSYGNVEGLIDALRCN